MAVRCDAQQLEIEKRRQLASERRRLLTFALHSERVLPANESFDTAVTDRFERLSIDDLDDEAPALPPPPAAPRVRAAGTIAPPSAPVSLAERVEQLRAQAAACRAQAISLNAKLVLLEAERARMCQDTGQVHAVREHLIESSARLDHAIEEIGAVASVEQQLADSLR